MGNLMSLSPEQGMDNSSNLKISMNFKEPVMNELKQLTNWSLQEIREIYVPFRKRKGSPVMSRSEFLRFIRLSRITSFFIYDKMFETCPVNVFEVIAILTLTSYAQVNHKVQFFFNLFDLEGDKMIRFKELVLMFTSLIRGYGILTGQALPSHNHLQKYAQTMFSRADLNNDQNLELGEVLGWFQSNKEAVELFARFEPDCLGKESYHVFNGFIPYKEHEIQLIFERLNKIYHCEQISEEDYKILTPATKKSFNRGKENHNFFMSLHQDNYLTKKSSKPPAGLFKSSIFDETIPFNKNNPFLASKDSSQQNTPMNRTGVKFADQNQKENTLSSMAKKANEKIPFLPTSKLPRLDGVKNKHLSRSTWQQSPKKSFQNIIIIKGKTITKKEVFDLRDYFDKISNGKKIILIEDFLQSFNQEKYNHMKSVAASLYNFLDKKQNGRVNFLELVLKLYPDLTKNHLKIVEAWSQEYNTSFNLDKKIKANRQQEQHKKRILPKTCLPRFKEIYRLFDKNNKGFVSFEDIKRVLGDVSTDKELLDTFEASDTDRDGKLSFQQFSHILLPPDLEIEGLQ